MSKRSLILGAALLCGASTVGALPIVDQDQSIRNLRIAGFDQPGLAQSFIQKSDNIVGAGIWLFADDNDAAKRGGNVTIALYDALPISTFAAAAALNGAGSAPLASGTAFGEPGDLVEVFFKELVELKKGATYFLVFTATNGFLGIGGGGGQEPGPYPDGSAYANNFTRFAQFDYAFQTLAEERVAPVPEPGTFVLLALAFAGVGFARRRPRN